MKLEMCKDDWKVSMKRILNTHKKNRNSILFGDIASNFQILFNFYFNLLVTSFSKIVNSIL